MQQPFSEQQEHFLQQSPFAQHAPSVFLQQQSSAQGLSQDLFIFMQQPFSEQQEHFLQLSPFAQHAPSVFLQQQSSAQGFCILEHPALVLQPCPAARSPAGKPM